MSLSMHFLILYPQDELDAIERVLANTVNNNSSLRESVVQSNG